jgi:tRNA pseudouridine55 synthase
MSRRDPATGPNGICIVDKPSGWTSHDVVARARKLLGTRKVGHAGTLDPMATGVLVLGVGRATRLLTFITGVDKDYEAVIRFGIETDSLDADGEVTVRHDVDHVDAAAVTAAASGLTGALSQVPPMVSAIKVDGRRLHQLAREGVEVERAPRPVHVERFDVAPTDEPLVWTASVRCSSGTYVRSLAADLGHALGVGAHLAGLRRTRVGPFGIDEATELEHPVVLPMAAGVRHLPSVAVDADTAAQVRHGRVLPVEPLFGEPGEAVDDGPWAVVDGDGALLAVYQRNGEDRVKPAVVLADAQAG